MGGKGFFRKPMLYPTELRAHWGIGADMVLTPKPNTL